MRGRGAIPDPSAPLTPSGNLRRRQVVSKLAEYAATAAAVLAVAVLAIVIYTVVSRGADALSFDFLVKGAPDGIGPMLVGTGVIVGIATLMAAPVGILIALYVTEYAGRRSARAIQMTLDVMNGLPSIIIALFIFGLLIYKKEQSGFAGSIALAIIMVPLIARGTQEILLLVPKAQREAADALGVARWRTVLTIILPSAIGGIATATVLAVARAAGETAPLLFTSSNFNPSEYALNPFEPLPNVPIRIFQLSEDPNPEAVTEAWGLALVLVALILIASLSARFLLARSKRKMGGT